MRRRFDIGAVEKSAVCGVAGSVFGVPGVGQSPVSGLADADRVQLATWFRRGRLAVLGGAFIAIVLAGDFAAAQSQREFDKLYGESAQLMLAGQFGEAEELGKRLHEWVTRGPLAGDSLRRVKGSNLLGEIYRNQGRYAAAETLHQEALEISRERVGARDVLVVESLHNLALLEYARGRFTQAEPRFQQALERVSEDEQPDLVARLKNNLANSYHRQGRYAEAEPLHRRALSIRQELLEEGPTETHSQAVVAESLNNLAALYFDQNRFLEAKPLHQEALAIRRKLLDKRHPLLARSLTNMAGVHRALGQPAEAEPLYLEALEIRRNLFKDGHPETAITLHNLAVFYEDRGRYQKAETHFREALQLYQRWVGDQHPLIAEAWDNLAGLYFRQGRDEEANRLLDQAEAIVERGWCEPQLVARLRWKRAWALWEAGQHQQATDVLEQALQALESQRTDVSGGELHRAEFFGGWMHLFELMVSWQAYLDQPAEAFWWIERSRARSLLDQLQTAGLDPLAGLPQQQAAKLRRQESEAIERVAVARTALYRFERQGNVRSPDANRKHLQLEAELHEAESGFVQAYEKFRSASPAFRLGIGGDQQPFRAEELARCFPDARTLVLQYLLGQDLGVVVSLAGEEVLRVDKLRLTADQAATLQVDKGPLTAERLRQSLVRDDGTGVLDHLRASRTPERKQAAVRGLACLWQVLIPEEQREAILQDRYERLVVLPDADLALLPFETLVVASDGQVEYLLDRGPPLVYAPSATSLVNLMRRQDRATSPAEEPVLSVGDCRYASTDATACVDGINRTSYTPWPVDLRPLKYADWEVRWVASMFRKRDIQVRELRGDEAREHNVRQLISGRRVVHFATHGIADQRIGNLFGALALTPGPSPDNPEDDGWLTLSEIYDLDLAGCELAILSACETNVGPQQRGEGVWALSRGFLVAGARRVAASSWLLDDRAAASTVSYFCALLADQKVSGTTVDYAQALHQTKRWLRRVHDDDTNMRAPYYWAPLVLIGPP